MVILGWIVWCLVAVVALFLMSGSSYPGVGYIMRIQGFVLVIGLVVTLLTPVSKLHLLWVVPLAFVAPKFVVQNRANRIVDESNRRIDEAVKAGVPIKEAMEQESARLANRS
jgi:hypothetical protein